MTADVFESGDAAVVKADGRETDAQDILAPERVATLVSYLASPASAEISGQVFVVYGDMVALMAAPTVERKFTAETGTFSVEDLDDVLTPYFRGRPPQQTFAAYSVAALDTTGTNG